MAASEIRFRRGPILDPNIITTIPPLDAIIYDGINIIPEMNINNCSPWVQTNRNYLFIGNVCVNPDWEGNSPIEVSGPYFKDDPDHSGEYEDYGRFVNNVTLHYNNRYFSVLNGELIIRLGDGLILTQNNGIAVDFSQISHNVATSRQLGEVKTSWDGSIYLASDTAGLSIDGLYAGKATGRSVLNESNLYPVLSEYGQNPSWLWSYKYAPNNVFETISGNNTNGRLYTVIRPASSNLAGCIKVGRPLGRIDSSSTEQFPGPLSTYKWLSDSTSDVSGCESSTTYLAKLTNRYDLIANCGVDIDALMNSNPYDPTSITQQSNASRRDTLFETFVPLPVPTYLHPGIAKLSYNGFVFNGAPTFTPDSTLKTYPIGINNANQLVTVGPRKLSDLTNDLTLSDLTDVGHSTTPKSGEILMYSDEEWTNEEPSSIREYTLNESKFISSSDSPFEVYFDENNFFQNFYIGDDSLSNGMNINLPGYGGEYYIIIDGRSITTSKNVELKSVLISRAKVDKVYVRGEFTQSNISTTFPVTVGKVTLLTIKASKYIESAGKIDIAFITAEEYVELS